MAVVCLQQAPTNCNEIVTSYYECWFWMCEANCRVWFSLKQCILGSNVYLGSGRLNISNLISRDWWYLLQGSASSMLQLSASLYLFIQNTVYQYCWNWLHACYCKGNWRKVSMVWLSRHKKMSYGNQSAQSVRIRKVYPCRCGTRVDGASWWTWTSCAEGAVSVLYDFMTLSVRKYTSEGSSRLGYLW